MIIVTMHLYWDHQAQAQPGQSAHLVVEAVEAGELAPVQGYSIMIYTREVVNLLCCLYLMRQISERRE